MCWSGEASLTLAAFGLSATAYAAYKGKEMAVWCALGYFSLMELLQAYTYTVIDDPSLPANQVATLLGYIHVAFQPFFINAFSMHFIPPEARKKVQFFVYAFCFATAIMFYFQSYPFEWAGQCVKGGFCGKGLYSAHGEWHIAWYVPLNGIKSWLDFIMPQWFFMKNCPNSNTFYAVAAFVLPVLYGSWRFTLYHFVLGPLLAVMTTNNINNEAPAIWCLLSIAFISATHIPFIERLLHNKRWFFYGRKPKAEALSG